MSLATLFGTTLLAQAALCHGTVEPCTLEGVVERTVVPRDAQGVAYDLSVVTGINLGPDGKLYVLQPQDFSLLAVGDDGVGLRIGRRGEGPGEFQGPAGFGWVGDSLWVADARAGRVAVFGPDGEHLDTRVIPVHLHDSYAVGSVGALSSTGHILVTTRVMAVGPVGEDDGTLPILRVNVNGNATDTVASARLHNFSMTMLADPERGLAVTGRQPFRDNDLLAIRRTVDEPVIYVIDRSGNGPRADGMGRVRVRKITETGRFLAEEEVPVPAIRIEDSDVDLVIERLVGGMSTSFGGGAGRARTMRRRVREALYSPEYWPGVDRAVIDDEGRRWLRRWGTEGPGERWILLDGDAKILANVAMPADFEFHTAKGGRIWGVQLDDFDLPTITELALRESAADSDPASPEPALQASSS